VVLRFLTEVWSKYLYVSHLRDGLESRAWQEGMGDIRTLVRSLLIADPDEMFRFYRSRLSSTLGRLKAGAESIHQDAGLVHEFFRTLDAVHVQILQGAKVEMPDPVEVPPSGDPGTADTRTAASADALALAETLREGDWYRLLDSGLELRCKLVEKNTRHGYCLFTNFSGIKSARLGLPRAAEAIENGTLQPLGNTGSFERALAAACDQLAAFIPRLEAKVQEARALKTAMADRRREAGELERLRRAEDARRQAEERRDEEERLRSEALARREAEHRQHLAQEARAQALGKALQAVDRLQPGACLDLITSAGDRALCKLGLRLKSTGKMIFVDRFGRKRAEFLPPALAEQVVEGNASILDFGVAFDETLQALITRRSATLPGETQR
jgi:hypothetical protein